VPLCASTTRKLRKSKSRDLEYFEVEIRAANGKEASQDNPSGFCMAQLFLET
jgi:hypothetical protein